MLKQSACDTVNSVLMQRDRWRPGQKFVFKAVVKRGAGNSNPICDLRTGLLERWIQLRFRLGDFSSDLGNIRISSRPRANLGLN